ncbi:MAG: Uncharacterised protein [Prochlorococcus marinus str. MIT 9215]|nr:MAG: Uncharacterised protein [Prochlorococcus marinus str. MIT 9215]
MRRAADWQKLRQALENAEYNKSPASLQQPRGGGKISQKVSPVTQKRYLPEALAA